MTCGPDIFAKARRRSKLIGNPCDRDSHAATSRVEGETTPRSPWAGDPGLERISLRRGRAHRVGCSPCGEHGQEQNPDDDQDNMIEDESDPNKVKDGSRDAEQAELEAQAPPGKKAAKAKAKGQP